MDNEIYFQVALSAVPSIGPVQSKLLLDYFGSASSIFQASLQQLAQVDGIGKLKAKAIKEFKDFKWVEDEINYCSKNNIQILYPQHKLFPKRMLHCYDAPNLLFYKGNANLNASKIVSIVGTRNHSEYGKQITEEIIASFLNEDVVVVSGLAYGIDAIAHKAAIKNQLATVGVLAHGLDIIYPFQHKTLAKEMIAMGGLLTEFPKGSKADKHNFPRRNRIVAGISDAIIVIETDVNGGSMITAEIAYSYNKDLFAVPGKITDSKSKGCLQLIAKQKAQIFTSVPQFMQAMNWEKKAKPKAQQTQLFTNLTVEENKIVEILQQKDTVHIDEIYSLSGFNSSTIAGTILSLELQNIIVALPGKTYRLQ